MSNSINKCNAQETAACCCVDVGAIIDNTDCTATYEQVFASKTEAEAMLNTLTEKAHSVASEPCKISSHFTEVGNTVKLEASFSFSCQAETMIFQLGLR